MVKDGFCNDETNNPDCNYDGGDCCGSCVVTKHYSKCQCLGRVAGIELSSPSIGDGYCQDGNNNKACNYDGGDCCSLNINSEHCTECICHHQETCAAGNHPLVGDGYCQDETNNGACNYDGGDCCVNADLIANGICNDETNHGTCLFDGGDCCLFSPRTDHCSQCLCHTNGIITSPGYPQGYDNNLDLDWLIQVPIGQTININFMSFDVEFLTSCR